MAYSFVARFLKLNLERERERDVCEHKEDRVGDGLPFRGEFEGE